jgi:hypothetical protein
MEARRFEFQDMTQSELLVRDIFRLRSDSLSDFLRFFLAVMDSWPLSPSSESVVSESELELEEELLELSEAIPDGCSMFILSASLARSCSCFRRALSHFLDSIGRPRAVLCHTTGKFVRLQKFCVTAIVVSRFRTTCHQPPGMKTVSPGFCRISMGWQSLGHEGSFVFG